MQKNAALYLLRLVLQRLLGLLLFWLGAGGPPGLRAKLYFGVYLLIAVVSGLVMYHVNPTTLQERGKVDTDSPLWDKILLTAFWLLAYFGIYFAAGKSAVPQDPDRWFWFGLALVLASAALTLWAMVENTFLESTARLQTDRGQTVCDGGPYAFIRHPTYAAVLLWCAAIPMIFPGIAVTGLAGGIAVIIVIRTRLEDAMLQAGLEGYAAYAGRVRYRLLPFIW